MSVRRLPLPSAIAAAMLVALACWPSAPAAAEKPPADQGGSPTDDDGRPGGPADDGDDGALDEAPDDDWGDDDWGDDDWGDDDWGDDDWGDDDSATEGEPAEPPPPPVTGPPRPAPLPEIATPPAPSWQRHVEVGAGPVYVSRPLLGDVDATAPRLHASVGFAIDLRWDLLSFLRVHPYFLHVVHGVSLPPGTLVTDAPGSISGQTGFPDTSAATFSFGTKLEPVLRLDEHLRVWVAAGVGWGRLRIPVQVLEEPTVGELFLPDRSFSFVEFPLGIGTGVDVIERWLALNYDLTVVPVIGQSGNALEPLQGIDETGRLREVGALDPFDVYFAHFLHLALIL